MSTETVYMPKEVILMLGVTTISEAAIKSMGLAVKRITLWRPQEDSG